MDKSFKMYREKIEITLESAKKSNDVFSKEANILGNLKAWITNPEYLYSKDLFRQKVLDEFEVITSENRSVTLMNFLLASSSSKEEALNAISKMYGIIKPMSFEYKAMQKVKSIAEEYLNTIK